MTYIVRRISPDRHLRANGEKLEIFEVKSSQTYNKAFEKNLNYLQELLGDKIQSKAVVYDGDFIPPIHYQHTATDTVAASFRSSSTVDVTQ